MLSSGNIIDCTVSSLFGDCCCCLMIYYSLLPLEGYWHEIQRYCCLTNSRSICRVINPTTVLFSWDLFNCNHPSKGLYANNNSSRPIKLFYTVSWIWMLYYMHFHVYLFIFYNVLLFYFLFLGFIQFYINQKNNLGCKKIYFRRHREGLNLALLIIVKQ